MKDKNSHTLLFLFFISCFFIHASCKKQPYKPDYSNMAGYVIGKEICNTDDTKDYWLIDFTYDPNPPRVGDTLLLNGTTYTNVLKIKDLGQRLKQIGMRVSIDYKTISGTKVVTTSCTVSTPVTYTLKEIFIINQGEIR